MFFALVVSLFLSPTFAQDLDQLVASTSARTGLFHCPGVRLVVSCGNKVCERFRNEDEATCPADCIDAPIRSYNHQVICQSVQEVKVPQTEAEVQDIVREAISKKIRVKPVGALHSASNTICTDGLAVPMGSFNKVRGLSEINGVKVVEVEAGTTVFALSEWLYEKGFALAGIPNMGFRDVTVAGAIATGSHGSSSKHSGVISNIVEAVEFIDGLGEHHYFERATTSESTFKALTANLGLLGVVTALKFAVQPRFNLEVNVTYHSDRELLTKGVQALVEDCDYGQLNWFPGKHKFMRTCGKKSDKSADLLADNILLEPSIPNFAVNTFKRALQLGACSKGVMCLVEKARYGLFKLQPPFRNSNGKTKHQLVGPVHRMVSSHLTKAQQGFFQMDWEIAVPKSHAQEALKFIKDHFAKNRTCLPLVGVFIRFSLSESRSWLAHTTSTGGDWKEGEPAVFFETPVYLPVGFSKEQMDAYEASYVEFTRTLITKFSGRPHWAKNRQWAFDLTRDLGAYGDNIAHFQEAVDRFDPNGVFANDFAQRLGIRYQH